MKNKILIFIAGILTGALMHMGFSSIPSKNSDEVHFFEEAGECVTQDQLKVFQTLDPGYALAFKLTSKSSYDIEFALPSSLIVLIYNPKGEMYYDSQVIRIPEGKCARQIGIYKYHTKDESIKTVPIVQIMK